MNHDLRLVVAFGVAVSGYVGARIKDRAAVASFGQLASKDSSRKAGSRNCKRRHVTKNSTRLPVAVLATGTASE